MNPESRRTALWTLAVALLVALAGTGIYLLVREYAIYEKKPAAVRLAEDLLSAVRADNAGADAASVVFFNGEGVDARLLPQLRASLGEFWRQGGETEISEGCVFAQNPYKVAFSQEAYVRRVLCAHTVGERTRVFWLDYQVASGRFIPRVWVDARALEESPGPQTP